MPPPTTNVTIFDETGAAIAVVQRDALLSNLPAGTSSAVVLAGGVSSDGRARAQARDTGGRAQVLLYNAAGDPIGSTTVNSQISVNVAIKETPVANPGDSVWMIPAVNPYTTTTTAKATVVEYTVPANKEFYLAGWSLSKITVNSIAGSPGTIEVRNAADTVTTLYDKMILETPATGGLAIWAPPTITPIRIAVAGEKVRLTVTPSGGNTTEWFGKLVGILRSV